MPARPDFEALASRRRDQPGWQPAPAIPGRLALNKSLEGAIYTQMLTYRRYPANLFVVSDQLRPALMSALQ